MLIISEVTRRKIVEVILLNSVDQTWDIRTFEHLLNPSRVK